jgi:hypothetical protein
MNLLIIWNCEDIKVALISKKISMVKKIKQYIFFSELILNGKYIPIMYSNIIKMLFLCCEYFKYKY